MRNRRAWRVGALILGIVALSIGDLVMTLTYLTHGGMLEANPIARSVMAFQSPALLAGWKLGSLALAAAIFFTARKTRTGEAGAWFCLCVLGWLTIRWTVYNDHMSQFGWSSIAHLASNEEQWVAMQPLGP